MKNTTKFLENIMGKYVLGVGKHYLFKAQKSLAIGKIFIKWTALKQEHGLHSNMSFKKVTKQSQRGPNCLSMYPTEDSDPEYISNFYNNADNIKGKRTKGGCAQHHQKNAN